MQGKPRLKLSLALDSAQQEWIIPRTRIGFLSLGLTDNANPGFYP